MAYMIAYGVDTETLADPDEMVLLALPEECADMDSEDLESWIRGNWEGIDRQPLVGQRDMRPDLALWFTPAAIREHFDGGDPGDYPGIEAATDEELEEVGAWCLSQDTLYRLYHSLLIDAAIDAGLVKG
jgi:hypothetical protein